MEELHSRFIIEWNQLRDIVDRDFRTSSVWMMDLDK